MGGWRNARKRFGDPPPPRQAIRLSPPGNPPLATGEFTFRRREIRLSPSGSPSFVAGKSIFAIGKSAFCPRNLPFAVRQSTFRLREIHLSPPGNSPSPPGNHTGEGATGRKKQDAGREEGKKWKGKGKESERGRSEEEDAPERSTRYGKNMERRASWRAEEYSVKKPQRGGGQNTKQDEPGSSVAGKQ